MIDAKQIEEWKVAIERAWPEWGSQTESHPAAAMEALGFAGVTIANVRTLLAEREEMLALLREFEWVDTSDGEYRQQCPACQAHGPTERYEEGQQLARTVPPRVIRTRRPAPWKVIPVPADPHLPDCRLAAFIGAPTMIDDDEPTPADLEAEALQQHQAKEQAEYDAKPSCPKCGHHPGDALHVCGKPDTTPEPSTATIMAPDGVLTVQEYEAAGEAGGLPPPSKQDLIAKVNEWMPDATPAEKVAEAKRLIGRWMLLDLAYKAGLRQGRDLRELAEYGKGWMWAELMPLTTGERTFVLAKVREQVIGRARA